MSMARPLSKIPHHGINAGAARWFRGNRAAAGVGTGASRVVGPSGRAQASARALKRRMGNDDRMGARASARRAAAPTRLPRLRVPDGCSAI